MRSPNQRTVRAEMVESELFKSGEWFTSVEMAEELQCSKPASRQTLVNLEFDFLVEVDRSSNRIVRYRNKQTAKVVVKIPHRLSNWQPPRAANQQHYSPWLVV